MSFTRGSRGVEKVDKTSSQEGNRMSSIVVPATEAGPEEPASKWHRDARRYEYFCLGSLSFSTFLSGWGDGSNGPLIPTMQDYYQVNYTIVSMIFIPYAVGYVVGAIANLRMMQRLGFGTTLVIGAILQMIAFAVQAAAPPFPAFAAIYALPGFGVALQCSGGLTFSIKLKNNHKKLAIFSASYGVGALLAPLSATKFAQLPHWNFHYLISLGLALVNVLLLSFSLRFRRLDDILARAGQVVDKQDVSQSEGMYRQLFRMKAVHILAFFSLIYTGVEVTVGGWIVTFVKVERAGGASSGYLSTGYWAGLTAGRLVLIWFTNFIGERRVVYLYVALSMALQISIWLVPSLVENAIAVAFIGFFFGPVYPILTSVAKRVIPHWLLNGAIGWYGALGLSGAAIFPFICGALSTDFGISSLHPLVIALLVSMIFLWALVPADLIQDETESQTNANSSTTT